MRLVTSLCCLILLSCKSGPGSENVFSQPAYESLQLKLDSLYESYFDSDGPGAGLLISYNGEKIVCKGYGLRDLKSKYQITPSTNMRSGSMAKQFTDLGILSLMEEGKLALTDTVYKYFSYPTFKNVTISQFISHTSGLEDGDWVLENSEWHSTEYAKNEDILDWYSKNEVIRFAPGTDFEYNNGTYVVLAQIIEKVSGMAYEDYINEYVFSKAGMINTQFIDNADSSNIPEYAYRYEKDSLGEWQSVEGHFLDEEVGPGGIYLSLNDYFPYLEALRNKTILKPETHEYIFKPISMNMELHSEDLSILKNKNSSYAMGWEVTDSLALSAGLWNGTNNFVIFERKRPLTIVMLANNNELFKYRLVDKTYAIVKEYFDTAANKVYEP
jgi:CubicO group peptidase (beta-lactamase class C family)